jgi:hypothetical protein
MIDMKIIIEKAKEWAIVEIEKNGHPAQMNFDTANDVGQKLATKLGADKDVVLLGTILMDIKLGEYFNSSNRREHTEKGGEAVKLFLEDYGLDEEKITKVVNGVRAHHGDEPFKSLEAEIVANTDCYRFLLPQNMLEHISRNRQKGNSFMDVIEFADKKLEEKWNILSIDICKQELKPYYEAFRILFDGII